MDAAEEPSVEDFKRNLHVHTLIRLLSLAHDSGHMAGRLPMKLNLSRLGASPSQVIRADPSALQRPCLQT